MSWTVFYAPIITFREGTIIPNTSAGQDADESPNLWHLGDALLDPRGAYTYYPGMADGLIGFSSSGAAINAAPVLGWLSAQYQVADWAPGTASTTSLASGAAISSTTTVTLITTSAGNITVGSSTINPQTGATVTGLWLIDNVPNWVYFGQGKAVGIWDPTNPPIARAISITSTGNVSGITFTVSGYDAYGNPITSVLAGGTTSTSVYTGKTFKWISSVTASATSSNTVSIGVADIYGFPMVASAVGYVEMWWNNTNIATNATVLGTFVAATTATTTGATDIRGTINPSNIATSNGTVKMQMWQRVSVANMALGQSGLFGGVPA